MAAEKASSTVSLLTRVDSGSASVPLIRSTSSPASGPSAIAGRRRRRLSASKHALLAIR